MNGLPISNYSIWQLKKYTKIIIIFLISSFIAANIITAVITERISADPKAVTYKNGFPIFTDSEEYIKLVRSYPYDFGTKIKIYKIKRGETFWDAASANNITLDTLIAANPFITSLLAKEGTELVIPSENGVLMALNNISDVRRMAGLLKYKGKAEGYYSHSIFRLFSLDDIRFAFFKDALPEIINDSLNKLYALRRIFQSPIHGPYTSMYGTRVDPFIHGMAFHNGIDINGKTGDPIYAAREGIVSFTGWRKNLGKCITIQHLDGYETIYGHCSRIEVKPGQIVSKKDIIGRIGSTGRSTGSHLHFMIRRHGEHINPLIFIW